ncbi:MAG TPA: ABC transporter substrate-binding protein [bacterium]|jgi:iron complex transport system substrate-binding protein
MPRIVSLLPSATEIVCALGFRGDLVGRSHECDFPAGVEALPACTAPRLDIAGSSAAIDRDVRALLRDALSIYDLDVERLRALQPGVVVTQTQCDVCAVPLAQVEQAAQACLAPDACIVALEPTSLGAVWADMRRVAAALGVPQRGETLVAGLLARMQALAAAAQDLPERPRVVTLEWIEPLMAGGNWMPELVALAGGVNALGTAGAHSPVIAWEALQAADADVLLVLPCGFDLARTRGEAAALTRLPGWQRLRAVQAGRVFLADGHQYFNRPGPRLAESLEILAEVLHPGAFRFGHEGRGWERMAR